MSGDGLRSEATRSTSTVAVLSVQVFGMKGGRACQYLRSLEPKEMESWTTSPFAYSLNNQGGLGCSGKDSPLEEGVQEPGPLPRS